MNNGSLLQARHAVITRREKASGTLAAGTIGELAYAEPVRNAGAWHRPEVRAANRALANDLEAQRNLRASLPRPQEVAALLRKYNRPWHPTTKAPAPSPH
jgi:hypothetical protein